MTEGLLRAIASPEEAMSKWGLDLTIDHFVVYEKPPIPGKQYGYDVKKEGVDAIRAKGEELIAEYNLANDLHNKWKEEKIIVFRANEDDEPGYEKYYVFYVPNSKKR